MAGVDDKKIDVNGIHVNTQIKTVVVENCKDQLFRQGGTNLNVRTNIEVLVSIGNREGGTEYSSEWAKLPVMSNEEGFQEEKSRFVDAVRKKALLEHKKLYYD